MPLPLLFIVPAAAAGVGGAGKSVKSILDHQKASSMTNDANTRVENAKTSLENARRNCAEALNDLGEEKLFVLNHSIPEFIEAFEQLKNVELTDSLGLEELKNFHIDEADFEELKELSHFAVSFAGGAAAGAAGGALTAFGAYSAAMTFASASTGTAIASLSGAAATNATLAFFGGGSLAAGGLGMAGGMMVLGGFVAGPALLAMGLIAGKKADTELEQAKENAAQADEIVKELDTMTFQCNAIRRRTYLFYALLARLDALFTPQVFELEEIIEKEGVDFSQFTSASKKKVAACASLAGSIKAVLDTPILDESGALTEESLKLSEKLGLTFHI